MAINKGGRMVTLSAAPQAILERLGIQLSKSEILDTGRKGPNEMVFVSNKQTYVNVDAFVDNFFEALQVPKTKVKDPRKAAAGRYRNVNVTIMLTLLDYLFDPDSKEYSTPLKEQLLDNLGLFENSDVKKDGSAYGTTDLKKHLKSFAPKAEQGQEQEKEEEEDPKVTS